MYIGDEFRLLTFPERFNMAMTTNFDDILYVDRDFQMSDHRDLRGYNRFAGFEGMLDEDGRVAHMSVLLLTPQHPFDIDEHEAQCCCTEKIRRCMGTDKPFDLYPYLWFLGGRDSNERDFVKQTRLGYFILAAGRLKALNGILSIVFLFALAQIDINDKGQ